MTCFMPFCATEVRRMHHGEPKCFVNEVCTACFASVVHRLCEFGAFLAQEVTKICILMRKSISLVQVWAESRTSGENRHRILQVSTLQIIFLVVCHTRNSPQDRSLEGNIYRMIDPLIPPSRTPAAIARPSVSRTAARSIALTYCRCQTA